MMALNRRTGGDLFLKGLGSPDETVCRCSRARVNCKPDRIRFYSCVHEQEEDVSWLRQQDQWLRGRAGLDSLII